MGLMYSQITTTCRIRINKDGYLSMKEPKTIEQKLASMSQEDLTMLVYLLAKVVESCAYNADYKDIIGACLEEMYNGSSERLS